MSDSFEQFRKLLVTFTDLPPTEWEKFKAKGQVATFKKGEVFVELGEDAGMAGFVCSGLMKAFYTTHKGDEFIRNFAGDGMFMAAYSSWLTRTPSNVTIQAMLDSTLILFPYQAYQDLQKGHACWQEIGRKVSESLYIAREQRHYELLVYDAETQYENFCKEFKTILPHLSQQDIATYIGITPVSLSRMKAKTLKKRRNGKK